MSNDTTPTEKAPAMVKLSDPLLEHQFDRYVFQGESLSMGQPVSVPLDLLVHMYRSLGEQPTKENQE